MIAHRKSFFLVFSSVGECMEFKGLLMGRYPDPGHKDHPVPNWFEDNGAVTSLEAANAIPGNSACAVVYVSDFPSAYWCWVSCNPTTRDGLDRVTREFQRNWNPQESVSPEPQDAPLVVYHWKDFRENVLEYNGH